MSDTTGIIILGMHRSGTSATTGMLQCLGANLGSKLYAGHADINAKGYFEHSDITDADEEALLASSSAWDDVLPKAKDWHKSPLLQPYAQKIRRYLRRDFSKPALWALKDPRLCRLLPWWLDILAEEKLGANYLIVLRPPYEVCASLQKRDGFSSEKAYLLWLLHYLDAEYWTRGLPRTVTTFAALANDPVAEFKAIETALELRFPLSVDQAAEALSKFVAKDLIHHRRSTSAEDGTSRLGKLAERVYRHLLAMAEDKTLAADFELLDAANREVAEMQTAFPDLLAEQLRAAYQNRGKLQLTMNKIMRSWSWWVGKPIRLLERWIGRDV